MSKYVLGSSDNNFYRKKHQKRKIWANLANLSFRLQTSRNCSKSWILKDFFKIEKCQNAHPTGFQVTFHDHLWFWKPPLESQDKSRSNEKFEPSILWTHRGQAWRLAYKQNIAKNSLKIQFWRISSKLKKCQNAHPTGFQITFYGHPWFWKPPLVSQDKSRINGKLGPSIFWTHQSQAWRSHISKI